MTSPSGHKSCKSCNCAVPFKFVWNMTKVWAITQYWIATCWICPKTWNVMEKNAAEMIKDNFVAWIKLCHKVFPIHTLSYRLGISLPLPPHNKDKFTTYWCKVKVELTFTMFLQKNWGNSSLRILLPEIFSHVKEGSVRNLHTTTDFVWSLIYLPY